MAWQETAVEVPFVIYRCTWCRKLAVTRGGSPTPCCCNSEPVVRPPSRGRDPGGWP